ncbi:MAG TPA: pyridoxamine 5'-phosphate oxidase family protein [Vineibacter sp.]|nr:pyridoxamine 5'-phosphate oxidase family protein [Vineibacter sp.]
MQPDNATWSSLWDLIKDIRFGMMTLRHGDGTFRSRPMTTQNGKDDRGGVLWFFASRRGEPALDIDGEADVNVSYADPHKDAYVSVAGTAQLVDDLAKKRALFNTMTKAWFPGGVDDPDLVLISVTISHAEYWDVKSGHLTQAVKMLAAAATGKRVQLDAEHGEVGKR